MENDIERGNLYPPAGRDTEARHTGEGTFRGGDGPLKASVDPAFEARRRGREIDALAREQDAHRLSPNKHPVDQCNATCASGQAATRMSGRSMLAQKAEEYRMRGVEMTMRAMSLEKLLVTIPLEIPPLADEALWAMARELK